MSPCTLIPRHHSQSSHVTSISVVAILSQVQAVLLPVKMNCNPLLDASPAHGESTSVIETYVSSKNSHIRLKLEAYACQAEDFCICKKKAYRGLGLTPEGLLPQHPPRGGRREGNKWRRTPSQSTRARIANRMNCKDGTQAQGTLST
jgi:hypothetical protein